MRVPLNHATAYGPARIRTWDQRIMSSLRGQTAETGRDASALGAAFTPPGLISISADLGGSCCHRVVTLASAGSSVSTAPEGRRASRHGQAGSKWSRRTPRSGSEDGSSSPLSSLRSAQSARAIGCVSRSAANFRPFGRATRPRWKRRWTCRRREPRSRSLQRTSCASPERRACLGQELVKEALADVRPSRGAFVEDC